MAEPAVMALSAIVMLRLTDMGAALCLLRSCCNHHIGSTPRAALPPGSAAVSVFDLFTALYGHVYQGTGIRRDTNEERGDPCPASVEEVQRGSLQLAQSPQ